MDQIVRDGKPTAGSNIEIVELHNEPKHNSTSTQNAAEDWQPGFWRQFPWLGLGCLVSVLVLTTAAILVLIFSDGKATSQWNKNVAPNIILSILNSTASICITIAVAQGIAISWWRKAMRGASITDLHNTWSFGASFTSIFLNLKYFNLTALAALVTKLTIIDAVLFQRAASTYVALGPSHPHDITTFPTFSLPVTGQLNAYGNDTDIMLYAFSVDMVGFLDSAEGLIYSTNGYNDCDGICALNVSAPGYIANCTRTELTVDITADADARAARNNTLLSYTTDVFSVNFNLNFATPEKNYSWIGLNTTYYQGLDQDPANATSRCPATLYQTQCELRQALINYPVYLQNTTVSTKDAHNTESTVQVYLGTFDEENATYLGVPDFDSDIGQLSAFDFKNWIPSSEASGPLNETYDGGIYLTLQNQYKSRASITAQDSSSWYLSTEAQFANVLSNDALGSSNYSCPFSFDDPMWRIMLGLNTLTFITSDDVYNRPEYLNSNMSDTEVDAYKNRSIVYVPAIQFNTEVHYRTKFGWMFGALSSTLLCVALVLPVYWEFWKLGRKVSFNPVEIANAFQSPILGNLPSTSGHADDLVKVAGGQRVTYYADEALDAGRRYRIVPK